MTAISFCSLLCRLCDLRRRSVCSICWVSRIMHVIYKLLFSNPMNDAYNDNGRSSTTQHFQRLGNYNSQNAVGLSQLDPSLAPGHSWPYNVRMLFRVVVYLY